MILPLARLARLNWRKQCWRAPLTGDAYRSHSAALDLVYLEGNREPRRSTSGDHRQRGVADSTIRALVSCPFDWPIDWRPRQALFRAARRRLATAAAAQARDRVLSMRDARALIAAADRDGVGRILLLRLWRASRRFDVERPVIVPLSAKAEREAVAALAGAGGAHRGCGQRCAHSRKQRADRLRAGVSHVDAVMGLPTRMATVAAQRDLPPLAPVMIAVRGYSAMLRDADRIADRIARLRFVDRVVERRNARRRIRAARCAQRRRVPEADAVDPDGGRCAASVCAGTGLDPGRAAPSVRDLQSRFGVTGDLRRDYPRRLATVLPALARNRRSSTCGACSRVSIRAACRVHFGVSPLGDRALALHDPIRRTIYFPPTSHSGVMAHEFAHDLDWQAARREYGGTGWYRTDHALRQAVDQLAGALRQMASATRTDSANARMMGSARPTEVLARNVDWFVSASLAREGRVNGHLSAAQDPVLTGYASAITPEAARDGGSATLRALDGLTIGAVSDTRPGSPTCTGRDRRLTMHEAVRLVLEAPLGRMNRSGHEARSGRGNRRRFDQRFGPASAERFVDVPRRVVCGHARKMRARCARWFNTPPSHGRVVCFGQWTDFARRRP